MILIRKYDQSAWNAPSAKQVVNRAHHQKRLKIDELLLESMERSNSFGLSKTIIFTAMYDQLRNRPFRDKSRRIIAVMQWSL